MNATTIPKPKTKWKYLGWTPADTGLNLVRMADRLTRSDLLAARVSQFQRAWPGMTTKEVQAFWKMHAKSLGLLVEGGN